jgi:N-acetylmuramoyl-L-alanine amidase
MRTFRSKDCFGVTTGLLDFRWTLRMISRVLARVRFFLASVVLLIAAGCAGGGPKVTPLERGVPVETAKPVVLPEPIPKPAVVPVETPKVEPVKPAVDLGATNRPALRGPTPRGARSSTIETSAPNTNWVSLREWCAENKVKEAVKISITETNVELKGERGTFVFEPPRRNARWNGTLIGVGFAPILTNYAVFVNALDLEKVVKPLMFPETAPARKNGGVLVIDAGHGGTNFGTLSFDRKLREKDLTLDWAKRLQKLLEGSKWQVVMTREVDLDLALTQRVAIAEMKKADLFVSLHFNSAGTASAKTVAGLETYCFTPQGMESHITRGYSDEVGVAFGNNRFDVENLELALDVHRAILKRTGRTDRGIRRARFMTVLREQQRPAVLIEGGYLSNPDEAKLIATPEFRQKLAEAVAEALGVTPRSLTANEK